MGICGSGRWRRRLVGGRLDHGPGESAQPPQRVISLLPSLTESVCALGACERLVGADRYSNWPESVQRLPKVGGGVDPNIESIVALRPDVVLASASSSGVEPIRT